MNIQTKKRGKTEISREIEQDIIAKFQKLERLIPETAFLELEFIDEFGQRNGLDKTLEINLDIPGKEAIHLSEVTEDFRASADGIFDKLEQIIIKIKEKEHNHMHQPSKEDFLEEASEEE